MRSAYTQITLQFDLSRAHRRGGQRHAVGDQRRGRTAAAEPCRIRRTIRKVNPADTPILVLGMTSDSLPLTTVDAYARKHSAAEDLADIRRRPRRVSEVSRSRPSAYRSIRRRWQLAASASEDVRTVLGQANVDLPKGTLNSPRQTYTLNTNDQLLKPDDYADLVIAYRNGSPVRVARCRPRHQCGRENDLIAGWYNHQRAIILGNPAPARRQRHRDRGAGQGDVAGAPGLDPVRRSRSNIISDRTETIRASVADVQFTLLLTVALVVMVIFLFLRNFWATDHPGRHRAAVAGRHLRGALRAGLQPRQPLADGVVDRRRLRGRRCRRRHREHRTASGGGRFATGRARSRARARSASPIMSITLSLIAVFIPLFLMSGYVGLLFREFAVTVSVALVLSLLISLTLTPMMCARLLKPRERGARMALPVVRTRLRRPAPSL